MAKNLDKIINDLVENFRQELKILKEEELEEDYIEFLRNELREEFMIARTKKAKEKLLKEIKEELKKCKGQDAEISLEQKVEFIQVLIHDILVVKKYDL